MLEGSGRGAPGIGNCGQWGVVPQSVENLSVAVTVQEPKRYAAGVRQECAA